MRKPSESHFNPPNDERSLLKQLYREYDWILRRQKLPLKRAAIEIMDSETKWGTWDSLTHTLSLSQKLLKNQNWFQVLGVLKHEMAHQWVDELCAPGSVDGPHGAVFKKACIAVGVPEQFRGATTSLQENGLDWRLENSDEQADQLLNKVKKLLALATSSNEHEALLAMNKVRELYAKYNLNQVSLLTEASFVHQIIYTQKKRIEVYQKMIVGILVGYFFVQVITGREFDVQSGEETRIIELVGTRENVLMAEYVYHFLLYQIEALTDDAQKNSPKKLTRVERKSYRLGILKGFSNKLKHAETPEPKKETELSTALAVLKKNPKLESYIGKVYPKLGTVKTARYRYDGSAFSAGMSAGAKLTLNKAVTTKDGFRKRLLAKF